jgi:hypothetical protein
VGNRRSCQSSCYFTSYKQHTLSRIWPSSLSVELSNQNIFSAGILVVVCRGSFYSMTFFGICCFLFRSWYFIETSLKAKWYYMQLRLLPPSPQIDTIIVSHPPDPQPHSPHPIYTYPDDNSHNSKVFMLNLAHFSDMYCITSVQLATDQYNVLDHKYGVRKQLFSIHKKVCILNTLLWPVTICSSLTKSDKQLISTSQLLVLCDDSYK